MLWWWIIGMTDLMLHQKAPDEQYHEENGKANDEVFKLHPMKQAEEKN